MVDWQFVLTLCIVQQSVIADRNRPTSRHHWRWMEFHNGNRWLLQQPANNYKQT